MVPIRKRRPKIRYKDWTVIPASVSYMERYARQCITYEPLSPVSPVNGCTGGLYQSRLLSILALQSRPILTRWGVSRFASARGAGRGDGSVEFEWETPQPCGRGALYQDS